MRIGVLFLGLVTLVFVSHAPFLKLPFFWDEVGQFIPASLDLFQEGALVPRSVTPNAHPPGVMAYLSGVWSVFGYSIVATRAAMLLLAGVCVCIAYLLAIRLGAGEASAMFAALLLTGSPVFYGQAMLAQLDMPAALFTLLATLLFLEDRFAGCAIACTALVLMKETGVVVPMLFGLWLLLERRFRLAVLFTLPAVALGGWFLYLHRETGHWFGSAEFTQYNLTYMLHPARAGFALGKRIYHLFFENLHWIGTVGIVCGIRRGGLYANRGWRIAWTLVGLHVVLFSVLGGAILERYLLPVTPIVYIAMLAGWSAMAAPWRILAPAVLVLAVAACNFWNPPYPFPLENNLAFTDFVKLHQEAASFLEQRYRETPVLTAWPLSAELIHPELGYVAATYPARELQDFGASTINGLENRKTDIFVLYSRQWDPPANLLRSAILGGAWRRVFRYEDQITPAEVDRVFGLKLARRWTLRGQWIEIHARY